MYRGGVQPRPIRLNAGNSCSQKKSDALAAVKPHRTNLETSNLATYIDKENNQIICLRNGIGRSHENQLHVNFS